jgi:hypothetical protein
MSEFEENKDLKVLYSSRGTMRPFFRNRNEIVGQLSSRYLLTCNGLDGAASVKDAYVILDSSEMHLSQRRSLYLSESASTAQKPKNHQKTDDLDASATTLLNY